MLEFVGCAGVEANVGFEDKGSNSSALKMIIGQQSVENFEVGIS